MILDPVGGSARRASLQRLAPHGRLLAYGNLSTEDPVLADTDNLLSQTLPARLADSAHRALLSSPRSRCGWTSPPNTTWPT